MESTNIVIHGAAGRMGREIASIVFADPDVCLSGAIESAGHPSLGQDMGVLCGLPSRGIPVTSLSQTVPVDESVIIDFTAPGATMMLLERFSESRARFVIGTTGLGEPEIALIKTASRKRAILFSPNMSMGVNLLFHITELVARRLAGLFDMEIIEAHHRHKKDSPSGTARRLGEIAAGALNQSYEESIKNGRAGLVGERAQNEVGMHAVRGGDIVGDHTVLFAGDGERLELRHMAHSRATFAKGAVQAAKWLSTREPGLYSMKDVLGL